jgi:hypothetical protein
LERGEIEVRIPLHEFDAADKAARGKKVVRVKEYDKLGVAFFDTNVAADIRAGFFGGSPDVTDAWIGRSSPSDFLGRAVVRPIVHNEVLPGIEALPLD